MRIFSAILLLCECLVASGATLRAPDATHRVRVAHRTRVLARDLSLLRALNHSLQQQPRRGNSSSATAVRSVLELAVHLHKRNQIAEALTHYDTVLHFDPGNADALHCKGLALFSLGGQGAAASLRLVRRALRLSPRRPLFWNSYAELLRVSGEPGLAVEAGGTL